MDDLWGSLHCGQQVPRQRTVPKAGNPRNPAMSPHPAPNRLSTVKNMGWEGRWKKWRRRKHSTEKIRYALARWNVLSRYDRECLEHSPISATADCHEHIGCPLMSTQLNCIYQLNRNLWRMGAWVELSEGLHGHQPAPRQRNRSHGWQSLQLSHELHTKLKGPPGGQKHPELKGIMAGGQSSSLKTKTSSPEALPLYLRAIPA